MLNSHAGIGEVIKGEYNKNISTNVDSWVISHNRNSIKA